MRILIVCGVVTLLWGQALAADNTNPLYKDNAQTGANAVYTGKSDRKPAGAGDAAAQGTPAGGGTSSPLYDAQGLEARKGNMGNAQSNPLYEDTGHSATNPLHKGD